MDPLSITASSIAVLSAVTASGRGFNKLLSLRKAPAEVLALSNEVQALRSLLVIVENSLLEIQGTKTYQNNKTELTALLQRVKDTVLDFEKTIEYRLKRAEASSQDDMPKVSHSQWLRAAPEIERLRQRIQDARGNLNVGLMAINIEIGQVWHAEKVRRTAVEIQSITLTPEVTNGSSGIVSTGNLGRPTPIGAGRTRGPTMEPPYSTPSTNEEVDTQDNRLALSDSLPINFSETSTNIIRTFGHRGDEYPSEDVIRVHTTISIRRCEKFCQCQCHVSSYIRTPQWLRRTLGHLMFSYTNLIRPKPCNYPLCNRSPKKAHFTYMFPWWLASRALIASCVIDNITGSTAGWAIRMPIVIPNGAKVWRAVIDNSLYDMQRLFSSGEATPFMVDEGGDNLLHHAIHNYDGDIHKFLLEQGVADDMENQSRETPAELAMIYGTTDVFSYDPEDAAESLRFTPLHVALVTPTLQLDFTYELLKQQWAYINVADKSGMTPLHWASRLGNASAVRLLLDWKADINLLTAKGDSALHHATWGGDFECVKLLLHAGCDSNLPNRLGLTPLSKLRDSEDNVAILDLLIQFGANVNESSRTGVTPLHLAAMFGRTELIHSLVSHGADINALDRLGNSSMQYSVMWDFDSCIEALSQASDLKKISLRWNLNGEGRNALHYAALCGSAATMTALAEVDLVGLDPMAKTREGNTPNACFYEVRQYFMTTERESFDVEQEAWEILMLSACRQNGIDPMTLSWFGYICPEIEDVSVAESEASEEENFADALENLRQLYASTEARRYYLNDMQL